MITIKGSIQNKKKSILLSEPIFFLGCAAYYTMNIFEYIDVFVAL